MIERRQRVKEHAITSIDRTAVLLEPPVIKLSVAQRDALRMRQPDHLFHRSLRAAVVVVIVVVVCAVVGPEAEVAQHEVALRVWLHPLLPTPQQQPVPPASQRTANAHPGVENRLMQKTYGRKPVLNLVLSCVCQKPVLAKKMIVFLHRFGRKWQAKNEFFFPDAPAGMLSTEALIPASNAPAGLPPLSARAVECVPTQ